MKNWLIYGANGYTGRLIAQQAKSLGGMLDVIFSKGLHEEVGVVVVLSQVG